MLIYAECNIQMMHRHKQVSEVPFNVVDILVH